MFNYAGPLSTSSVDYALEMRHLSSSPHYRPFEV
uniref:Uncharacterized protein n=1 Tax=Anguilla anguilla TaxID=7936 RepID=A0A0E9TBF3_ANGAN